MRTAGQEKEAFAQNNRGYHKLTASLHSTWSRKLGQGGIIHKKLFHMLDPNFESDPHQIGRLGAEITKIAAFASVVGVFA